MQQIQRENYTLGQCEDEPTDKATYILKKSAMEAIHVRTKP